MTLKYFITDLPKNENKTLLLLQARRKRMFIGGIYNLFKITAGDIIALVFWKEAIIYKFEGICLSVRYKSQLNSNAGLCVRNVLFGIGIEVTAALYSTRIYYLTILDYKRKQFLYRKSKLYYLRYKLNQASRVKL